MSGGSVCLRIFGVPFLIIIKVGAYVMTWMISLPISRRKYGYLTFAFMKP